MAEQNDNLSVANTPSEINIHLGYIRRDILAMQTSTQKDLQEIKKQISELDDHYISGAEFEPFRKMFDKHEEDIRVLTEWKDTLNGKMIGFGLAVSIITAMIEFAISNFIK